jgi:hypothetical protein
MGGGENRPEHTHRQYRESSTEQTKQQREQIAVEENSRDYRLLKMQTLKTLFCITSTVIFRAL